ncbi:MAG: PAS domain S-box protein, partial [Candidatus Hodarchaeales archaeon]
MTNVLLVDDDKNLLPMAKILLENQEPSFMVTTSTSAKDAFVKLAEAQFDVIISDYKMPEMNGLAFLKILRGESNLTPFIMFTGQGREEVAIDALNLGANYYLMKGADTRSTFGELAHIIRQLAEHKQTEEALRESEERFSKAFQLSPQSIVISRLSDGQILEVNKALVSTTGYSREELIGNTTDELGLVRAEDRERGKRIFQKQGSLSNFEAPFFTKTDEKRIGSFSGEIISIRDELCIIQVIDDITDSRLAEKALRRERDRMQQYLDTAGVNIDVLDAQGNIVLINKKGCEVLGYDNETELLGKNWIDTFRAEKDREGVKRAYRALMAGELDLITHYESSIIAKNGEERLISWHHRLLTDESGAITGILSSGTDITEKKRKEEENKQLLLQLEQINRELAKTNQDLLESEELFTQFMDHVPAAAFIKDSDGITLFANQYLNDVFGGGTWIGKTTEELFPAEIAQKMIAADQKALEEGLQIIVEELLEKNNVINTYQTYKFPINRADKANLLGGIAINITEQKNAEMMLKESQ